MEIDFFTFNILEGSFWVALSFVVVFYFLNEIPERYRFLGAYTGATLFIFGLSDFAEAFLGSFMFHPNEWLFVLKTCVVLMQVFAIFWYLRMRLREGEELLLE